MNKEENANYLHTGDTVECGAFVDWVIKDDEGKYHDLSSVQCGNCGHLNLKHELVEQER